MTDRIFLRLDDRHAIGADDLQWVLYRAKRPVPTDAALVLERGGPWRGISFVRSTKAILLRCIREAGCKPCSQAHPALESLPATFDAWKAAGATNPAERRRLLEAGKRMEAYMAKRMPPTVQPLTEAAE